MSDNKSENKEENKEEKPKEISTSEIICREIFLTFIKKYEPVETIQEADHFPSTNDIHSEILAHCPNLDISESLVYTLLKENGFSYDILEGSVKYVWLLKNKS